MSGAPRRAPAIRARAIAMSYTQAVKTACTDPKSSQAKLLLKLLSLGAGGFLVFAGFWGAVSTPILGGGMIYFIGSLYAILFGTVVLALEVKDKSAIVSKFYDWLDTYLKFLTLQVCAGASLRRGLPRATALTRARFARARSEARAPSTSASASSSSSCRPTIACSASTTSRRSSWPSSAGCTRSR